jgi:hypothetical protein
MRRICAWCGDDLGGCSAPLLPLTHGVCARCVRALRAGLRAANGVEADGDRCSRAPAQARRSAGADTARAKRGGPVVPAQTRVR